MLRLTPVILMLLTLAVGPISTVAAQPGQGISVSVALVPVDFGPKDVSAAIDFQFDGVVPGVVLSREGLYASVHRGSAIWTDGDGEDRDLDLFDVNLSILGSLLEDHLEGSVLTVPVMLHSSFRRIQRVEGGSDFAAFEYTGLGLGVGLGAEGGNDRLRAAARVVPGIGLATRSFGTSGGRTTLVDTDVEVRISQAFGRFGIVAGYGFRWQGWRVGGPDAFDAAGSGNVTYEGTTQTARVGLSW